MHNARVWALSLAFVVGCGSSDGGIATDDVAGGGARAYGGSAQLGGVSGAQASAGIGAGPSKGGTGGSPSANASGGSNAGAPMAGGTSGAPGSGGRGSAGSGGRSNSGGGGRAGRGGSASFSGAANAEGGSGGKPATGGAGSCVQNLGCKLQAPASTGDLHQDCVDRINQFRTQCACLSPLSRSTDGEACADQMAEYDAAKNEAHAGWEDKICKPSGAQNSCPGYSSNNQVVSLCMQQMWDEGPPPSNPCNGQCFEDHGHFINMTTTSSSKVACGFYTTSGGKVWAVQNFF